MRAQSGIICALSRAGIGVFLWAGLCFADDQNGNAALQAAERLAWLRNWSAALPHYRQAEREFTASGDRRNALFVQALPNNEERNAINWSREMMPSRRSAVGWSTGRTVRWI